MSKKRNLADAVKQASNIKTKPKSTQQTNTTVAEPTILTRQANRMGKRNIAGWFEDPVHRQLRVLAAEEGFSQQDLLGEALNLLFEKYGKNPIA